MIGLNIEMPSSCRECQFCEGNRYCQFIHEYCDALAAWVAHCRPKQCPLIDLGDKEVQE